MEAPKSAVTGNSTDQFHDQRDLQSRLSDIAQIPIWIGQLALRYNIPEDLQFAMDLCLEEALSNIIIYGYLREEGHPLTVRFATPRDGCFVFEVEDEAPLFNPLEAPELPPLGPNQEMRIGGQGIRLLRRFAHKLAYEPTTKGNLLRIEFLQNGEVSS